MYIEMLRILFMNSNHNLIVKLIIIIIRLGMLNLQLYYNTIILLSKLFTFVYVYIYTYMCVCMHA